MQAPPNGDPAPFLTFEQRALETSAVSNVCQTAQHRVRIYLVLPLTRDYPLIRPGGGRGEDHFSWDYWLERSILMTGWVQCRSEVRYRQKSRVNTPPTVYSYQNAKNVTFSTLEAALRCVHRRSIARPQPHSGFRGFWCDNAAIYPRWVSLLPLAQMARLDIKLRGSREGWASVFWCRSRNRSFSFYASISGAPWPP